MLLAFALDHNIPRAELTKSMLNVRLSSQVSSPLSSVSDTCQTLTPRLHRSDKCHCEDALSVRNPVIGKVHVRRGATSALGRVTQHRIGGMQGHEEATYLEKRFRMRPAGVVSKKVIGDLKIA